MRGRKIEINIEKGIIEDYKKRIKISKIAEKYKIGSVSVYRVINKNKVDKKFPKQKNITIKCATCGEEIEVPFCRSKNRKYCSPECYYKSLKGKPSPFNTRIKSICPICNREFLHKKSVKRIYCSRFCLGQSKKGKPSWNKGIHMWKNKPHPRGTLGKPSKFKGKRIEEIIGEERAKEIREKNRIDTSKKWEDPNYRLAMSLAHKDKMCGKDNPFYGHKHTQETREKISSILINLPPEKKRERSEKLSKSQTAYFNKNTEAERRFFEAGKKARKPYIYTKKGEWVRSKGECQIANWLFEHNIEYRYESERVKNDETSMIPDFYLPQEKTYIEFWGMRDLKYVQRMNKKQTIYQEKGINLLSIYYKDFEKKKIPTILAERFGILGSTQKN